MSAMIYNPNIVATEASLLSTSYEKQVGEQLSHMLGYATPQGTEKLPAPWCQITDQLPASRGHVAGQLPASWGHITSLVYVTWLSRRPSSTYP